MQEKRFDEEHCKAQAATVGKNLEVKEAKDSD
jgi:hypothetical protein